MIASRGIDYDELNCKHGEYFVLCEQCAPCAQHDIHAHDCDTLVTDTAVDASKDYTTKD